MELSFFSKAGVGELTLITPSHELESSVPGFSPELATNLGPVPKDSMRLQLRCGEISIFAYMMRIMGDSCPVVGTIVGSPYAFNNTIHEIIAFYSDPDQIAITPEESFALLRLMVYGGGMKEWITALTTDGVFKTPDDEIILTTSGGKTLRNCDKTEDGYWKRPRTLSAFSRTCSKAISKIRSVNQTLVDELSTAKQAFEYRENSRLMFNIIQRFSAELTSVAAEAVLSRGYVGGGSKHHIDCRPGMIQFELGPWGVITPIDAEQEIFSAIRRHFKNTAPSYICFVPQFLELPVPVMCAAKRDFFKKRKLD